MSNAILTNKNLKKISFRDFKKKLFEDRSLQLLLLLNLVTIFFTIRGHWELSTILWIYWFQSVIIGFFNFLRILQLKEFSTEGLEINDQPAQSTKATKIFIAFFFLFHYGFFHLVYSFFLFSDGSAISSLEWKNIFLTALMFFLNHLFSHFYNRPKDTKKQNIGSLMFYPYARIIPMHVTIIFGGLFMGFILPFLLLKTLADVIMHAVEHEVLRRGEVH